jgi:cyclophilin family peptidyl-prolyl cis-trans isomerase
LVVLSVITGWAGESKKSKSKSKSKGKHPVVTLETTKGTIEITLYPEDAPKHCANFLKLVGEKFYDGIVFHRVIPGFMAQTGDPLTKQDPNHPGAGTGGAKDAGGQEYTLPAEIKRDHKRGTIAAARTDNPERRSSSSQFYICFDTAGVQHLNGQYSAFGEVTRGMDVVDKIQRGDKIKKATVNK